MGNNEDQDWFVLLHLSDIHFTKRSNGHLDLDRRGHAGTVQFHEAFLADGE